MDSKPQIPEEPEAPDELAKRLSLPIQQVHLLSRALTHRSYVNEHPEVVEDNERLEFLGDAVLDFVVAAWLYHHCPEMQEGDLTRMRAALVCEEQLAAFARQLNLGRALRLGRGEANAGGRDRPALLCATFEAVVGALYLDGGISAVEAFVLPLVAEAAKEIMRHSELYDPKSRLQEWTQAQKMGRPEYVVIGESGPDHAKTFEIEVRVNGEVYGRGVGSSKQAAAQAAAQAALKRLGLV
ncbi:MAG: ribonuclease III [Anaerolineae bacterium]|nr:MAG: ribonuclease III [Anaerolineae bacterium]